MYRTPPQLMFSHPTHTTGESTAAPSAPTLPPVPAPIAPQARDPPTAPPVPTHPVTAPLTAATPRGMHAIHIWGHDYHERKFAGYTVYY